MAKATLAPIMGDVKGSIANVTFQGGKAGLTLRAKVVPINVKSSAQVAQRSALSVRSKAWRGLTDAQRDSWDTAAASAEWTQTDVFAIGFQLSGEQLYMKLNLVISFLGETPIVLPPTKATFAAMGLSTLVATAGVAALTVAYTGTLAADQQIMISASPQVSQGIMSAKSVSFVNIANDTAATPLNILTPYVAKKGTLVAGKKIFIRMEVASDLTGEKILIGEGSVIVSA